jgi:hypothetical protein
LAVPIGLRGTIAGMRDAVDARKLAKQIAEAAVLQIDH